MKRFKDGIMVTYIWQAFLEVYFYSNIITCQDIYMECLFKNIQNSSHKLYSLIYCYICK